MTESHEASARTLQAPGHHELPFPGPVLITEQEVVLGITTAVQALPGDPYLVDQANSPVAGDRPDVAFLDENTPMHETRDALPMNTLDALTTISAFMLLVIFAIGIQSLQAWLEQWDYDRHSQD